MQKWFHNQMLLPYLGGDDICHEEFFKMMKAIATHTHYNTLGFKWET